MSNGKYSRKHKGVATKTMILVLAVMLIVGCTIGGTLAWLTATTDEVKNTFTTSDISITLDETKGGANKEFKMVPGYTIEKDPKVTVLAGSEKCYLFVKLEKSTNFDTFMTYTTASGWTALTGVTNVYYRVVDASTANQVFDVLNGNSVSVKGTVTKADMNALTSTTYPTLTVTAYASQYFKNNTEPFTPNEAWNNVNPVTP